MSDILKRLEDLGVTKGMPLIAKTAIDKTRNPLKALKESFPNAIIGENEYGEYFLNQKVWPIETIHGKVSLNQSCVPSALFDSILGGEGVRKEDTLAMDTETSGLSNGAGGFVFMIGMGYFSENNYFVDQLILPDLADEKAFLHQIEITFARFPVLLTYNGKGFDIPMIQSRINFHCS